MNDGIDQRGYVHVKYDVNGNVIVVNVINDGIIEEERLYIL